MLSDGVTEYLELEERTRGDVQEFSPNPVCNFQELWFKASGNFKNSPKVSVI